LILEAGGFIANIDYVNGSVAFNLRKEKQISELDGVIVTAIWVAMGQKNRYPNQSTHKSLTLLQSRATEPYPLNGPAVGGESRFLALSFPMAPVFPDIIFS
jgi:hypothetical protein